MSSDRITPEKQAHARDARLDAAYTYGTTDEKDARRADAIAREKDGRSRTSRANLGEHVPDRLDPLDETVVLTVRMPRRLLDEIVRHADCFGMSRSAAARDCIIHGLRHMGDLEPW